MGDLRAARAAGGLVGAAERATRLLDGVREWIAAQPDDRTDRAYDQWALTLSEAATAPREMRATSASIKHAYGLRDWEDVLRVAEDPTLDPFEIASEQILARTAQHRHYRLVSSIEVAVLLGVNANTAVAHEPHARQQRWPSPVAKFAWVTVWLLDDVLEFRDTGKLIRRQPYRLQDELLSARQVQERLGIGRQALLLARKRGRPHLAPPLAGQVGRYMFWLRDEVEAWEREHADVVAARRTGGRAPRRPVE